MSRPIWLAWILISIGCDAAPLTATRDQKVESAPLGRIAIEPDHDVVFYEQPDEPGMIVIDESGTTWQRAVVTDVLADEGPAAVWLVLARGEPMPRELADAIERSTLSFPEDPEGDVRFAEQYGEPPVMGGENALRTQAEVNWFATTWCGKQPEHCLLFDMLAWSISPKTSTWSAVAANARNDHLPTFVNLDTFYWGVLNGQWTWKVILPWIIIPSNHWHLRTVKSGTQRQYHANAWTGAPYELIGLRTGWMAPMSPPPPPPPPPPSQCLYTARAYTTNCWDYTGQIFYANKLAVACGVTPSAAQTKAVLKLTTMTTCLSNLSQVDCCNYAVDPATPGCECP